MANKKNTKKVVKKNTADSELTLVIGTLLVTINDFTEGNIFEKIFVVIGFIFMICGIVPIMIKSKKEKRYGMFAVSILFIVLIIAFVTMLIINNI